MRYVLKMTYNNNIKIILMINNIFIFYHNQDQIYISNKSGLITKLICFKNVTLK